MSTIDNTAVSKVDVYQKVTDAIVNAIEQGVGNWRMPWHTSSKFAFSPINVSSHRPYRGINTVSLWAAAQQKGYERCEWGTYNQWKDCGAQVRRGEKATTVVFWKFANESSESQDVVEERPQSGSRLLFTRGYSVFNASQVDGYIPEANSDVPVSGRIAQADAFFGGIGADVRHGGNRAYYSPSTDHIQLPPFQHSTRRRHTIRRSPMNTATGLQRRAVVIDSWEGDSATMRTPPKNWSRNLERRSSVHCWDSAVNRARIMPSTLLLG